MKKKIVLLLGIAAAAWGVKKLVSGGTETIEPWVQPEPQQSDEQLAA